MSPCADGRYARGGRVGGYAQDYYFEPKGLLEGRERCFDPVRLIVFFIEFETDVDLLSAPAIFIYGRKHLFEAAIDDKDQLGEIVDRKIEFVPPRDVGFSNIRR